MVGSMSAQVDGLPCGTPGGAVRLGDAGRRLSHFLPPGKMSKGGGSGILQHFFSLRSDFGNFPVIAGLNIIRHAPKFNFF